MLTRFKLPDVGEGLTEAEVVHWHVAAGDVVEVNDVICDVETAKSVVELPSPVAGVVDAILVEAGQLVPVGTALVAFRTASPAVAENRGTEPGPRSAVSAPEPEKTRSAAEAAPLVLVGTGPRDARARRRRLTPVAESRSATAAPAAIGRARATPPVRLLARRLGVDLERLAEGRAERLVRENDVLAAAAPPVPHRPGGQPSDFLREDRTPIKGVRRATAEAMVSSAFTAPHVTEWLSVDATPAMELLARLKQHPAWAGVRVTPLVLVAKALLSAVRRHPGINARWDEAAQEIVQPHYVNLGIAAATERGLVVPNIKDAHAMGLAELARAIESLVSTARSGRSLPVDMARGTITVTNLGSLGVDGGTPILNPGEAAILAMGAIRPMPWVVGDRVEPRQVAHLAMSFDHRLVDGELGARVLVAVGEMLSDPAVALLGP